MRALSTRDEDFHEVERGFTFHGSQKSGGPLAGAAPSEKKRSVSANLLSSVRGDGLSNAHAQSPSRELWGSLTPECPASSHALSQAQNGCPTSSTGSPTPL